MKRLLAVAVALGPVCLSSPVFAQDPAPQGPVGDRQLSLGLGIPETLQLRGHVGVAIGAVPEFQGSDDLSAVGLPLVDIRQEDFMFISGASVNPNDGYGSIGWYALNFAYAQRGKRLFGLSVGPMIRVGVGRDEHDNSALDGLGDIDDSAGSGVFVEARAGSWTADISSTSQDAGDEGDGLLVAVRSRYSVQISERFSIAPAVVASWGDEDYMQGFYGVSNAQASRSGLTRFNAQSGFKDVGIQVGATYSLSEKFLINGQIGYQRLLGDAADSPIVDRKDGSRDQFSALFGIAYKF